MYKLQEQHFFDVHHILNFDALSLKTVSEAVLLAKSLKSINLSPANKDIFHFFYTVNGIAFKTRYDQVMELYLMML